ncbi:hypothetical protein IFM89_028253 [Coptis chinensis]|uniref:Uncharacterized protein n=1 Tax=Coptis chinensis TaxID=261450 RepID=A0A835IMQ2_9MAGN|nr:hypothetical protein IFM89_028253 [Coptis chinensis]
MIGSVVYYAFGSECVLEKDKFQELLLGFELTGLPFLVALKPPFGAKIRDLSPARSHYGSSSLWEALLNECLIVLLPQGTELFVSARRISTYLKAGVEIERREEDRWFNPESVFKAIKMVMDEDNKVGTEIKANKTKWKDFLSQESLDSSYIDNLVLKLQDLVD